MKHAKHSSTLINLRGAGMWDDESTCIPEDDASEIAHELMSAIYHLSKERSNCPLCGGIVPEICVLYRGKMFKFTCYDIVRGKKSIFKTDYRLMERYCHGLDKDCRHFADTSTGARPQKT
jgi:hypothetical protein